MMKETPINQNTLEGRVKKKVPIHYPASYATLTTSVIAGHSWASLDNISHVEDATETTVVFKNIKNRVFLMLPSVLRKIWTNRAYTELPSHVIWVTKPLYGLDVASPAKAVPRDPTHTCSLLVLFFLPLAYFIQSHFSPWINSLLLSTEQPWKRVFA